MINMLNRTNTHSHKGFSLAEMLLVLVILSFLIVSMAPIAYNKMPKKTDRAPHGRFECYYDGNKLMQYTADEIYGETTPIEVTQCEFNPPAKASFFIVQAIGGGAGGTYVTDDPYSTTPIFESGVINAPDTGLYDSVSLTWGSGGAYDLSNCTIADPGDAAGGSGGTCPTSWLGTYWNSHKPSITLDVCAAAGRNGTAYSLTYEDGHINSVPGGSGGPGTCAQITTGITLGSPFTINPTDLDLGGGNMTVTTPDVSCVLAGGDNGTNGHLAGTVLVPGTSGGTLSTDPATDCSNPAFSSYVSYIHSNSGAGVYQVDGTAGLPDITYKRQGTKAATRYGFMGNNGEYISMFFPELTESLDISIGRGGDEGTSYASPAGTDGGDTVIKLKNASATEALRAKGGKATALGGSYNFWLKGNTLVDTDAVDADGRFALTSGFSTFVELDQDSKMPSKITETLTGMGGDGAYSIVRETASVETISLNGVAIANETYTTPPENHQVYTCRTRDGSALKDDDGNEIKLNNPEVVCPAQKGHSGAVVIVW